MIAREISRPMVLGAPEGPPPCKPPALLESAQHHRPISNFDVGEKGVAHNRELVPSKHRVNRFAQLSTRAFVDATCAYPNLATSVLLSLSASVFDLLNTKLASRIAQVPHIVIRYFVSSPGMGEDSISWYAVVRKFLQS